MTEPTIVLCTERPFPALSACVREVGHDGACMFCRGVPDGSALTFYRARPRGGGFEAALRADLKPGERFGRMDAAALLALLEAAKDGSGG